MAGLQLKVDLLGRAPGRSKETVGWISEAEDRCIDESGDAILWSQRKLSFAFICQHCGHLGPGSVACNMQEKEKVRTLCRLQRTSGSLVSLFRAGAALDEVCQ